MLNNRGSISNAEMERSVETIYSEFEAKRKSAEAKAADQQDMDELNALEKNVQKRIRP